MAFSMVTIMRISVARGPFVGTAQENTAGTGTRNLESRCPRKLNTPFTELSLSQDWQDSKSQLMRPCHSRHRDMFHKPATPSSHAPAPGIIVKNNSKYELGILGIQKQVCNPQRA